MSGSPFLTPQWRTPPTTAVERLQDAISDALDKLGFRYTGYALSRWSAAPSGVGATISSHTDVSTLSASQTTHHAR